MANLMNLDGDQDQGRNRMAATEIRDKILEFLLPTGRLEVKTLSKLTGMTPQRLVFAARRWRNYFEMELGGKKKTVLAIQLHHHLMRVA